MASRRGGALLVAVAILALGAALLAGASASARAATRAEVTLEAILAAEAESRVALAERVMGWSAADDSLPIGRSVVRAYAPRRNGFGGFVARSVVRVHRVDTVLYMVAVRTRVGPDSAPWAQRRLGMLLARRALPDTATTAEIPSRIARWGMTDLF